VHAQRSAYGFKFRSDFGYSAINEYCSDKPQEAQRDVDDREWCASALEKEEDPRNEKEESEERRDDNEDFPSCLVHSLTVWELDP
jgi:hypothetical protein